MTKKIYVCLNESKWRRKNLPHWVFATNKKIVCRTNSLSQKQKHYFSELCHILYMYMVWLSLFFYIFFYMWPHTSRKMGVPTRIFFSLQRNSEKNNKSLSKWLSAWQPIISFVDMTQYDKQTKNVLFCCSYSVQTAKQLFTLFSLPHRNGGKFSK